MEGEEEDGGEWLSGVYECNAELMNHSNCLFYILILKVMGLDSGYTDINRTCYNDTSKRSVEKIDVYLYLRTRKTLPHNAKSLQTIPSPR
jgi:hypothetical protein